MNKTKIGIVSGYFNPIHVGHIQYINSAKEQCDYLICIVNNSKVAEIEESESMDRTALSIYLILLIISNL